jgi:hypothetical protein
MQRPLVRDGDCRPPYDHVDDMERRRSNNASPHSLDDAAILNALACDEASFLLPNPGQKSDPRLETAGIWRPSV